MFMASRLPVSIRITYRPYKKKECFLEDFEGRKLKTLLPHSGGREFVGLSRGYLVFFGRKTCDFWLVNPITRHELHFPAHPFSRYFRPTRLKVILVFSPWVVSEWVLVVSARYSHSIWFSVSGSGSWIRSNTSSQIYDLHFFKEKIYVLTRSCFYEFELYPMPEFILLQTKNLPRLYLTGEFVSTAANLYLMHCPSSDSVLVQLDFDDRKWVSCEKIEEYAAVKLGMWADIRSKWYLLHDCLNVNLIHNEP
ncbi:unnamed protein product [Lactuca virosa]|uniref:KIB1-4 beta-propeller domain-containing protein n=1 Tax=Lactuca virosa TaxID=75947 RepID=A0AAU9PJK8_9ASTR|nr:unnamed protein product [Lactuca virosa]